MEVKVRFRFNKLTGEVEQFEVLDEGTQQLPPVERDRQHDRIATEVGGIIEHDPRMVDVFAYLAEDHREDRDAEIGHDMPVPKERETRRHPKG